MESDQNEDGLYFLGIVDPRPSLSLSLSLDLALSHRSPPVPKLKPVLKTSLAGPNSLLHNLKNELGYVLRIGLCSLQ